MEIDQNLTLGTVFQKDHLRMYKEAVQDPDPHWFGFLDPDPHGDKKKLDTDLH
jgi:hypothetical protein